jgi:hypothetical protein
MNEATACDGETRGPGVAHGVWCLILVERKEEGALVKEDGSYVRSPDVNL